MGNQPSQTATLEENNGPLRRSKSGNALIVFCDAKQELLDEEDGEETVNCSSLLSKTDPFGNRRAQLLLPCSPTKKRHNQDAVMGLVSDDDDDDEASSSSQESASHLLFQACSMSKEENNNNVNNNYTLEELELPDGPTPESDLRPTGALGVRQFHIVTTAALPWMTGTAVNPLLRAAYLSDLNRRCSTAAQDDELCPSSTVTLVIPWLESPDDREALYGEQWRNKTKVDQDALIRQWLSQTAQMPLEADSEKGGIQIQFYAAKYHSRYGSIFAVQDICSLFDDDSEKLDVCFLEEPEHLNVYRAPGKRFWTDIFQHVVGVGHTNYVAYVQKESLVASALMSGFLGWIVKAYCHKLIKLSPVLPTFCAEKEVVCNIHGIRQDFLIHNDQQGVSSLEGIYFLGKLVWAKGLDRLVRLQHQWKQKNGSYFEFDLVGSGPEEDEIKALYERKEIPVTFQGRKDHYSYCAHRYKIFLNPSRSEVLCTATAEAIAMEKFVLLPLHPSNEWFQQFPNALLYRNGREFCQLLQHALTHAPEPLSADLKHQLTWQAATERCLEASIISRRDEARSQRLGFDRANKELAKWHNDLFCRGKRGQYFRAALGAGPVIAKQSSSNEDEDNADQEAWM